MERVKSDKNTGVKTETTTITEEKQPETVTCVRGFQIYMYDIFSQALLIWFCDCTHNLRDQGIKPSVNLKSDREWIVCYVLVASVISNSQFQSALDDRNCWQWAYGQKEVKMLLHLQETEELGWIVFVRFGFFLINTDKYEYTGSR